MEDFLVILLQFLFEFILNVLGNIPFDWPSKYRTTPEPEDIYERCFLWFLGGCALAGGSLLIARHTMIMSAELRLINLVLAPILSAIISQGIAKMRATDNPFIIPRNHFWQAFWFTLGLVIIRFTYATRT